MCLFGPQNQRMFAWESKIRTTRHYVDLKSILGILVHRGQNMLGLLAVGAMIVSRLPESCAVTTVSRMHLL